MNVSSEPKTVIVVGSGIIGIACAHYLSKTGIQVTVIDRKSIAGACSYGNCGYICPSHVLPLTEPGAFRVALKSLFAPHAPFRVKPRLSPALWNWMWQFAKRCTHRQMLASGNHLKSILDSSMVEYRKLIKEEQLDCEWTEKGLLYVLQTEKGMQEFSKTDQILSEHFGVKAHCIKGHDLPAFDPALKHDLAGAYYYPSDTSVRPDLLNSQWAERLKQNGIPYISVLTDPIYGGVSASLALLGDINIAEPDARAGFAGPNIIEQTIRQKLPAGFQRSEFLLEHGAIDMIVRRNDMRGTLAGLLSKLTCRPLASA